MSNSGGQIARLRGWLDPATPLPELAAIEQALREHRAQGKLRPVGRQSGLSSAHLTLIAQWFEHGVNAVAIHAALQRDHGVRCHYSSVRRAVNQLKAAQPQVRPTMILDFKLGEAAQVDFGAGPFLPDPASGKPKRTWFFVMTLCASRHQYVEFVWDQTVATWLRCHQRAFEFFGATPARLIIDNPKCAIIKAVLHETEVQRAYGELAQGYGFLIDPCPPADPQKKGAVESAIGHTQATALRGKRFESLEEQNEFLEHWETRWAAPRVHASARRPVEEMFREERPYLKALPVTSVQYFTELTRTVCDDTCIRHDHSSYAARPAPIGSQVLVRVFARHLEIRDQRTLALLRTHALVDRPGTVVLPNEERLFNPSRETRTILKQAQAIGPGALELCETLFGREGRVGQRKLWGIVGLARRYPRRIVDQACAMALRDGIHGYQAIKKLAERLTDEALEHLEAPVQNELTLTQSHPLIRDGEDYADLFTLGAKQSADLPLTSEDCH